MNEDELKAFQQVNERLDALEQHVAKQDKIIERMQIKIMGLESKIVGLEAEINHVNKKLLAIDNILHLDEYAAPGGTDA